MESYPANDALIRLAEIAERTRLKRKLKRNCYCNWQLWFWV